MDEILENQIRFKEQILREYLRLSRFSVTNQKRYKDTIDRMLEDLEVLYKQRRNE